MPRRKTTTTAEESRQALAAATATREVREAEDADAREKAGALRARLRCGDDSVTTAEFQTADTAVDRTSLLLDAARSAEKKANQNLVYDDIDLAEAIAPLIMEALRSKVPVEAHWQEPDVPKEAEVPLAHLIQSDPSDQREGGLIGGKLELRYHRMDLFRPLKQRALEDAAERHGIRLEVSYVNEGTERHGRPVVTDSAKIKVHAVARADLDLTAFVSDASTFASDAALSIFLAVTNVAEDPYLRPGPKPYAHTLRELHADDDLRRVEVQTTFSVNPQWRAAQAGDGSGPGMVFGGVRREKAASEQIEKGAWGDDEIRSAVNELTGEGRFVRGLGRVESLKVEVEGGVALNARREVRVTAIYLATVRAQAAAA